ncbi:MAG: HAD-IB family hydrolase [Deltaproteobacteria bacterium]|nr:HAD-IB family hydrolase [Deltaproteobacteria bacterium]
MALHEELTREVDDGPAGPNIAAFFDVDRTLIARFSALEFLRDGLSSGLVGPSQLRDAVVTAWRFQMRQIGFSAFVTGVSSMLRGQSETEFAATGARIFAERLAGDVYPESRALVLAHLKKGHTVAMVSAATRYQIEPLAHDLGIEHVLCTRLEVSDGRFTGEVVHPTCYGEGKALYARRLAKRLRLRLAQSYFYTDSDEDLPLLEAVGRPRPLNPNRKLTEIATARGWPTRSFSSRGTPSVADVVRTGLAVGSIVPSFLLGLPAALLDGSWRRAVNLATSTWGELGTALAGVDVRVVGEEHLWSHRPAVFIFNHQSGIDTLLIAKLLRRDIVAVAKQELRRNPIFGPAFALSGTVFIDRFDREKAIQALQPAVDALRQGLSLVIAPEGTRSPTPRLGKFKKGAFHMAMAAKVPLVPIVFRNALDALPKHGIVVRPSVIEAVVHPPIPTDRWTLADLEERIASVRRLYLETLGQQEK